MLKSSLSKIIFINVYSSVSVLLMIWLLLAMPFSHWLANIMALIAAGSFPTAFLIDILTRKQQYDPHLTILNMFSCCTFIWTIMFSALGIFNCVWIVLLTAFCMLGNLLYTYWFSSIGNRVEAYVKVGEYLPDFTLYDAAGTAVKRDQLLGQLNMLVFYRGGWCPICMAQIRQIHQLFVEVQERDIHLYFISAEPSAKRHMKAVDQNNQLYFLYDRHRDLAQKLGIDIAHGVPIWIQLLGYRRHTMVPTIMLVNKTGQIIFADFSKNYRVRPNKHDYMQHFDVLSR